MIEYLIRREKQIPHQVGTVFFFLLGRLFETEKENHTGAGTWGAATFHRTTGGNCNWDLRGIGLDVPSTMDILSN